MIGPMSLGNKLFECAKQVGWAWLLGVACATPFGCHKTEPTAWNLEKTIVEDRLRTATGKRVRLEAAVKAASKRRDELKLVYENAQQKMSERDLVLSPLSGDLRHADDELMEAERRRQMALGNETELSLRLALIGADNASRRDILFRLKALEDARRSSLTPCSRPGAPCPAGEDCNLDRSCRVGGPCSPPAGDSRCHRTCDLEEQECEAPEACLPVMRCRGGDACRTEHICAQPGSE